MPQYSRTTFSHSISHSFLEKGIYFLKPLITMHVSLFITFFKNIKHALMTFNLIVSHLSCIFSRQFPYVQVKNQLFFKHFPEKFHLNTKSYQKPIHLMCKSASAYSFLSMAISHSPQSCISFMSNQYYLSNMMLCFLTPRPFLSQALFHDAVHRVIMAHTGKKGIGIYQPCHWKQSDLL